MSGNTYERKRRAEEMQYQLVTFSMMIFFTLLSFISVELNVSKYFVIPFILLLAVVQVIFQLYYFMHMKVGNHGFIKFFMFSSLFVAIPIIIAFKLIIWW